MTYSVKYKRKGSLFWKKIKQVEGDGIIEMIAFKDKPEKAFLPYRWFMLSDKTRIEIPMNDTVFKFCRNRFYSIQKAMEKEAGQSISTN